MSAFDVNQMIRLQRLKKRLDELRERQKKTEEQLKTIITAEEEDNNKDKDKDKTKEQKPKSLRLAKRRYWQRVGRLSASR